VYLCDGSLKHESRSDFSFDIYLGDSSFKPEASNLTSTIINL